MVILFPVYRWYFISGKSLLYDEAYQYRILHGIDRIGRWAGEWDGCGLFVKLNKVFQVVGCFRTMHIGGVLTPISAALRVDPFAI